MRSLLAAFLLASIPYGAFGAISTVDGKVAPAVGASSASLVAETNARTAADALRLLKAGDTMTGLLTHSNAKVSHTGPADAMIYVSSTAARSRINIDMPGTGGKVEQMIFRTAGNSTRVVMSSNGINMAGLNNTIEGDGNRIFPFAGTQANLAWTSGDGLSSFSLASEGGAGGPFSLYDESTGNIIWSWQSGAPASSLTMDASGSLAFRSGDTAITTQGNGLILRATTGATCWRVTVTSLGILTTASVTCP